MPFFVRPPAAKETPVVVEIPHAGLKIDAEALATLVAPARCVGRDADLLVDELHCEAPAMGASMLVATTSRYVCDLNRAETDVDSTAVDGGELLNAPHGLIWRRSTEGHAALDRPLHRAEFERRVNTIYRPYHAKLRELLKEKQETFGFAILLCAHSMPSSGRTGHTDPGTGRADVVPGSRGRTTAAKAVIDLPERLGLARNWSVRHDVPYRGGFTTAHYGSPKTGVHAVQVELNRQLYMNEDTLSRKPDGFVQTSAFCTELVEALGRLGPDDLAR